MMCVRANMEDPVWVSEVLGEEAGEYGREPGKGLDGGETKKKKKKHIKHRSLVKGVPFVERDR